MKKALLTTFVALGSIAAEANPYTYDSSVNLSTYKSGGQTITYGTVGSTGPYNSYND